MAGHVTTNTSAALTATIPRTRQSMPDSKDLNPVSGKSHLKEALRARLVWTVYSIAHAKYMAPPTSQPAKNAKNKDKGLHSDDEEEPRQPNTGG